MSEIQLNYLLQFLNIGIPIALLITYFRLDKRPSFILCGIGAITPLLLFFIYVTVNYHLTDIKSDDLNFAYHAMWQMAGWAGPLLIIFGLLIGRFVLRNQSKIKNLFFGVAILPIIWGLAYALGNT